MILEGTVQKGMGIAKKWVKKIEKIFYDKTGLNLYPGTLNIKLNEGYDLKPDFIILKEEYDGDYNVLFQKCKIKDEEAYIVRSEKNIRKYRRL